VAEGRIYVARPPLYKVTEKKNVRFVQTAEAVHEELMSRGRRNARLMVFPPGGAEGSPRVLEGEELAALLKVMARLEVALETLEGGGINLTDFVKRATDRGLPTYRVMVGGHEEWYFAPEEAHAARLRGSGEPAGPAEEGEQGDIETDEPL